MRDYGKIECKFWGWAKKTRLSDEAKLMATYLLSGPHSNSVGCYPLPDGYIQGDLKWEPETISRTISELSRNHFVYRCEVTEYILIPDHLNHNPPVNGNIAKAMAKIIYSIPDDFSYWPELIETLKPFAVRFEKGFIKGLPNGMATQEQEQEQEQNNTPAEDEAETAPLPDEAAPEVPDEVDPLEIPESLRREPKPKAIDLIAAFDKIRTEVFGENMARPWPNQSDHTTAQQWLDNGATVEMVEGVLRGAMAGMQGRNDDPPELLKFFQRSIAGAIKQSKQPMPEGFPERKGGRQGPVGLHADAETNRWAGLVAGYFKDGFWPETHGPNPDQPDCDAPQELIEKLRPKEKAE